MTRRPTLGDNPLTILAGHPAPERPASNKHTYPTTSFRLPPEIVAELRAIAKEEGLEVGQLTAYALASFCKRYRDGEPLPMRERTIREVDLPP